MFIYALLVIVLFFLIVIWLGLDIYNNTKILSLPNGIFFKSFYFIMFAIVIFTIVNIGLAIYTYAITKNKVGSTGNKGCLLYTSPSPRDAHESRMPSSA